MPQNAVHIVIGAELAVMGLPEPALREVIEANTFENPAYASKDRLGLWTGDTESRIHLYRLITGGVVVPRGTFPIVVATCRKHGIRYEIEDRTVAPPLDMPVTSGPLFDYQARALDALLRYPTGMLEAPTGCGKTNVALSVIPHLGTRTVILTHTGELLQQTRQRCRDWLGVEPGILGAGKWDLRPVSVAMVQTLARRDLTDIARYFGCVLVDEAHHAPARTWAGILNQLPARYKYGFTATAWRKDRLQFVMWRTIGNITSKISQAEVARAGKIVTPNIERVDTAFEYDLTDASEWVWMITKLTEDEKRNDLIAGTARARVTSQTRALILSDRIEHVRRMAELLKDLHPIILTGELTKGSREAAMTAIRKGAPLTIATTSLLGEGVDVPGWDLLFLATPMAGGPRTLQAVGRVSRAAPGKDRATVIDFVDLGVPALVAAHAQRERLYAPENGRGRTGEQARP